MTPYKALLLVKALLEDYPDLLITGYLMDTYFTSYCAVGYVYKSPDYRDGAEIISEEISKVLEFETRYLIETVDGERFLIVNFHTCGGRRSLGYLLSLFMSGALSGSRYRVH